MSTMYKFYQRIGGTEPWTPIQAHLPLDEIRPTFVTVLALDTLIEDDTPKEVKAKVKYAGPMYFDLDAEDIAESIEGAQQLVKLLQEQDLTAADLQIYLSGKKGLHILIPEVCFNTKPGPVQGLPAVYKEIAHKFAVDTLDFRVYTAKKGRQFRTCYNVRENGNYKVPITLAELQNLTPELYSELCKHPRVVSGHDPKWRGKFSLAYDAALQKVSKLKPKVSKPVPLEILKQQLPIFTKVANGEVQTDAGFNVLAMQLSLYAREMKWTEDDFIARCAGVVANHNSDGSRYNSPSRRERELRRMFVYLEDNSGFDYSSAGLKSLAKTQVSEPDYHSGEEPEEEEADFAGVYTGTNCYMASKGEDGDVKITNFVFRDITVSKNIRDGSILSVSAKARIRGRDLQTALPPTCFTGGSSFQNVIASFGGSFSGTDVHSRGIYQAMLKHGKNELILDSEGVNLFQASAEDGGPKQEFLVWADRHGVADTGALQEAKINVRFQGFPEKEGLFKTDLTMAPPLHELLETAEGKERFISCVKAMMNSHTPEVMGKLLGWVVACFYAPIFQKKNGQFPLLHVYGPAGNGKTSTVRAMLHHFYFKEEIKESTPDSSIFAFQQMVSGSASIPLLLDEYKPHKMGREKLEQFRSVLRSAYNGKGIQRGGGNKQVKDNFNALSALVMSAPIVFVAEAPETETAIVERAVTVSFKRLAGKEQADCFRNAISFQRDPEPLASLGLVIANEVVETSIEDNMSHFNASLERAYKRFLSDPDDWTKVEAGEMTQEDARIRAIMRPRSVFSSTVSFFGLSVLKKILVRYLGAEEYNEHFGERLSEMSRCCFIGMDTLAEATLPEYVKILSTLSDMSKLPDTDSFKLVEGMDYNLTEQGGRPLLVLAHRQCYMKYRVYSKHTNTDPLYPSEESFQIAMREIPQFVKTGYGTKRLEAPTSVFDLEALYRAAVTKWHGRAVELDI